MTSLPETAPRPGSTASRRSVNSYQELRRRVTAAGLMQRRHGWYWSRIVGLVVAWSTVWAVVVVLGNSWWQLVPAAALGLVCAQFGFLGHDAAHRQAFTTWAWNEWTARILSGAFGGLSFQWWTEKHSRHHAAPNQEGKDPDIAPGALAFTPAVVDSRRTALSTWLTARQGWWFFPLLTLEGLNLQLVSLRAVLAPGPRPLGRWVETVLVTGRLAGVPLALFLLLPPGKAAAFLALHLAVFGVLIGAAFAPNHKGMPVIPPSTDLDFLRRQVLMSRNVRGGLVTDFMMGGLNHQIEHHLFPTMARPNLRRARPIIRAFCAEQGVPYTETGLLRSYAIVVRHLNSVGRGDRDLFRCPLAAQLRD